MFSLLLLYVKDIKSQVLSPSLRTIHALHLLLRIIWHIDQSEPVEHIPQQDMVFHSRVDTPITYAKKVTMKVNVKSTVFKPFFLALLCIVSEDIYESNSQNIL